MFKIPQAIFDKYNEAVDAMIDDNFGVDCVLYYPAEKTICSNCEFNSLLSVSSNIYKSGGPIPFTDGFCPYCNGDGYTNINTTEMIKLRCYFTPKHWVKISLDTKLNDNNLSYKIPDGAMQTIGHLSDLPKCRRATHIIVNSSQSNYLNSRYIILGEPVVHGFQRNKYFICMWQRAN